MSEQPTVFIVDDDEGVREAIVWALRKEGLHVESFPSAEAFLATVPADYPGCLVLDVRMQGMSGLDLQQVLNAHGCEIPIIFITGHGDIPTTVRAIKAGAVDFVEKPVSREVLIERVRDAFREDERRRHQRPVRAEVSGVRAAHSPAPFGTLRPYARPRTRCMNGSVSAAKSSSKAKGTASAAWARAMARITRAASAGSMAPVGSASP